MSSIWRWVLCRKTELIIIIRKGEKVCLRKCALVEWQSSQGFSFLSFPLNESQHLLKVATEWSLHRLKILGKVLVLHGEIHGTLETLVTGVDHLPRQPVQGLFDVHVVILIVRIVVPQTVSTEASGDGFHVHTS